MQHVKNCPFCNGRSRIMKLTRSGNAYRVKCSECGSCGPVVNVQPWHDTKYIAQGQAIELWNHRTEETS